MYLSATPNRNTLANFMTNSDTLLPGSSSILQEAQGSWRSPLNSDSVVADILSQNPDGSRDLFGEKFATGIGMPKKDVANYVASQWILVPRRFPGLQEAVNSGNTFIIRSESPSEYAWMSGIYTSHIAEVRPDVREEWFSLRRLYNDIEGLQARRSNHPEQQTYSMECWYLEWIQFDGTTLDNVSEEMIHRLMKKYFMKKETGRDGLDTRFPLKICILDEEGNKDSSEDYDDTKNVIIFDGNLPAEWTFEDILDLVKNKNTRYLSIRYIQDWLPKRLHIPRMEDCSVEIPDGGLTDILRNMEPENREAGNDRQTLDYSFWEYIPWINLAVCRDSVNENVYYIYRQWDSWKTRNMGCMWDGKAYWCIRVVRWDYQSSTYEKYISLYEKVAKLPVFDSKDSPIIEMQESAEWKVYFLQSLPTRPRQLLWSLERKLEPWEFEVWFVRGSTPPEWVEVLVLRADDIFYDTYEWINGFSLTTGHIRQLWEDQKFWRNKKFAKTVEWISRKSSLGMIVYARNGGGLSGRVQEGPEIVEWVVGDHGGRSIMHKPAVTVLIDEYHYNSLGIQYTQSPVRIRVISDGKRCFIKKLSH